MSPTVRCFVCGARDWRELQGRARCSHCGLDVDPARYDAPAHAAMLAELLRPGPLDLSARGFGADGPWTMDAYTLRIAASAVPLWVEPASARQAAALAHPHAGTAAVHLVAPPPPGSPAAAPPIGLGGIARTDEAKELADRCSSLAQPDAPVVVVADAEGSSTGNARTLARPLAGDFGAQRDAVQRALAERGARWVLQLDADETLPTDALDALAALAAQADRQGVVSIGLRRRNLVDGAWSDLWPDVQYRLNRAGVRYRGRVHERPDAGGWPRTAIALCATIEHHLTRARVIARSGAYEDLAAGGGRPNDVAALLRAFRP